MKKTETAFLVFVLFLFASCATVQPIVETANQSVQDVRGSHTNEEWMNWHKVNITVFREAEKNAFTKFGEELFGAFAELAEKGYEKRSSQQKEL